MRRLIRRSGRSDSRQVVVWKAWIDAQPLDEAASLLDGSELARFDSCRPEVARTAIVSHAVLRTVLADALRRPPRDLRFVVGANGKPALADPTTGLHFSLAHTDDVCVVAVTRLGPVGVDVERVQPAIPDLEAIVHRWFAPEEAAAILRRSGDARPEAFLRCWTRKEAYLKATGTGLTTPLGHVAVAVDGPARVLREDTARGRFALGDLQLGDGHIGAVAMPVLRGRRRCVIREINFRWPVRCGAVKS